MNQETINKHELEKFRNVYNDLDSIYAIFPRLCGLSGTEYWGLLMLYEGVSTQRDISEQLSLSRQTVNSAFRQLVKKGLVYLEPVENNLRTKQVFLTQEGIAFVEKYVSTMHGLEEEVWHTMEEHERIELVRLLSKYKDLMRESLQSYQKIK